jgi:hypothetical protein
MKIRVLLVFGCVLFVASLFTALVFGGIIATITMRLAIKLKMNIFDKILGMIIYVYDSVFFLPIHLLMLDRIRDADRGEH